MKKIGYLALLLSCGYIQCSKSKLEPLPEYKAPAGTKLNDFSLHLAGMAYDSTYTYILDDRYGYHAFFRIKDADGKMERISRFDDLNSFAVSDQYIYTSRPNPYPLAFSSFYRVNKNNYDDSVLINARMVYYNLTYFGGSLFGRDQLNDLCKIDPLTGNGTEILNTTDQYLSQMSFTSLMNSSTFYNGWWMFVNEDGKYLLKVKTDGSKQKDTIQSVKTPVYAIHNDRIYFSLKNPDYTIFRTAVTVSYLYCLASVSIDGGPVTIEDTTNLRMCNTVSNYGDLLLIGDGRFIKTYDPVSKKVSTIGAMSVTVSDAGYTMPAHPFLNSYTGSVYYSSYKDRYPVYKLK